MGATIEYDENGSVDHDHEQLKAERERREAEREEPEGREEGEGQLDHAGNVDTAADSGQSAATVSPVFAEADKFFAETGMPEGVAYAPYVDPAIEGEDAAVPDFANADERGRLVNDDGDIIDHTGAVVGNVNDDEHATGAVPEADDVDAEADEQAEGDEGEQFDPSEHTVDEVNKYLADADDAERERVLADEAKGQNRSTVKGNG